MKKLLIILSILLIAALGYYAFTTPGDQMNPNDETDIATSTDDVATSTDEDDMMDDDMNEDESATSTDDETSAAYCADLKANIAGSANWHIITNIVDGATISSGDEVRGCVYSVNDSYNNWAPFEGQIGSYEVVASDGTSLGMGALPTAVDGDWMAMATAGEALRYENTLEFDSAGYTEGTLIIRNENAAGLPEMGQSVEIDVVFE